MPSTTAELDDRVIRFNTVASGESLPFGRRVELAARAIAESQEVLVLLRSIGFSDLSEPLFEMIHRRLYDLSICAYYALDDDSQDLAEIRQRAYAYCADARCLAATGVAQ